MQESPERTDADGPALIQILSELTGLKVSEVRSEIGTILAANGASIENVTLDQLRQAMITYLEAVHDRVAIQRAGDALN